MADRAIEIYLNDHLAGANFGSDLAERIRARHQGSPLGDVMAPIAAQIEEDRQTLLDLMERLDVAKNPLKQAAGWVAEKASRVKLSGAGSTAPDQSTFMALETLSLGVQGKREMWTVLKAVQSHYPPLAETNLDALIERADSQHNVIEREHMGAGVLALTPDDDRS